MGYDRSIRPIRLGVDPARALVGAALGARPRAGLSRRRPAISGALEKTAACRGAAPKRGLGVPTDDSGSPFQARRRRQAAASLAVGSHGGLACRDAPAGTMRAAVAAPCLRWGHRWSLPPSARASSARHLAHPRAPRLARWRVSSDGRPEDAAELAGWCGSCCTEAAELRKVSDHRTVIVHDFSGTAHPRPHHESASVPTKTVNNPNKKMRYWRGYSKACPCASHKGEFIHTTVKIQSF